MIRDGKQQKYSRMTTQYSLSKFNLQYATFCAEIPFSALRLIEHCWSVSVCGQQVQVNCSQKLYLEIKLLYMFFFRLSLCTLGHIQTQVQPPNRRKHCRLKNMIRSRQGQLPNQHSLYLPFIVYKIGRVQRVAVGSLDVRSGRPYLEIVCPPNPYQEKRHVNKGERI